MPNIYLNQIILRQSYYGNSLKKLLLNIVFWKHYDASRYCVVVTDAHDTRSVKLQWESADPIELHVEKLNLPQFKLMEYYPTECKEEYKTGNASFFSVKLRSHYLN